jgi:hypothetical protein
MLLFCGALCAHSGRRAARGALVFLERKVEIADHAADQDLEPSELSPGQLFSVAMEPSANETKLMTLSARPAYEASFRSYSPRPQRAEYARGHLALRCSRRQ